MAILITIIFAIVGAVLAGLFSYGFSRVIVKGAESSRQMARLGMERGPQASRSKAERAFRRVETLQPPLVLFLVWWFRIFGTAFGGVAGGWVGARMGGLA